MISTAVLLISTLCISRAVRIYIAQIDEATDLYKEWMRLDVKDTSITVHEITEIYQIFCDEHPETDKQIATLVIDPSRNTGNWRHCNPEWTKRVVLTPADSISFAKHHDTEDKVWYMPPGTRLTYSLVEEEQPFFRDGLVSVKSYNSNDFDSGDKTEEEGEKIIVVINEPAGNYWYPIRMNQVTDYGAFKKSVIQYLDVDDSEYNAYDLFDDDNTKELSKVDGDENQLQNYDHFHLRVDTKILKKIHQRKRTKKFMIVFLSILLILAIIGAVVFMIVRKVVIEPRRQKSGDVKVEQDKQDDTNQDKV